MVNEIYKWTDFVKNVTKCVENMESIQKDLSNMDKKLKVNMNVVTWYNYTLHVIQFIIQLQSSVEDLFSYYKSASRNK